MIDIKFEYVPIIVKFVSPVIDHQNEVKANYQKYALQIKAESSHSNSLEQLLPITTKVPIVPNTLIKLELARPIQCEPKFRYRVKYIVNSLEISEQYWVLPNRIITKRMDEIEYVNGGVQLPEDAHTVSNISTTVVGAGSTIIDLNDYKLTNNNLLIINGLASGSKITVTYKVGYFVDNIIDTNCSVKFR